MSAWKPNHIKRASFYLPPLEWHIFLSVFHYRRQRRCFYSMGGDAIINRRMYATFITSWGVIPLKMLLCLLFQDKKGYLLWGNMCRHITSEYIILILLSDLTRFFLNPISVSRFFLTRTPFPYKRGPLSESALWIRRRKCPSPAASLCTTKNQQRSRLERRTSLRSNVGDTR